MASATASSPPILPISNPQPTTTTTTANATSAQSQQLPVPTPALRSFINNIIESVRHGLSQSRPWSELVDRTAFSKPESLSDAAARIRFNYSYFRLNYFAVIASILVFSLVSHPLALLLLLGLLSSWIFFYLFRPSDQPLVILGRAFSDKETLGALVVLSVVVVFLTTVGSVLISALLVGVALVCAHGAFRVPEDLFLDDQESSASTGFLSFLGGAASNTASSAAAVAGRV